MFALRNIMLGVRISARLYIWVCRDTHTDAHGEVEIYLKMNIEVFTLH